MLGFFWKERGEINEGLGILQASPCLWLFGLMFVGRSAQYSYYKGEKLMEKLGHISKSNG